MFHRLSKSKKSSDTRRIFNSPRFFDIVMKHCLSCLIHYHSRRLDYYVPFRNGVSASVPAEIEFKSLKMVVFRHKHSKKNQNP